MLNLTHEQPTPDLNVKAYRAGRRIWIGTLPGIDAVLSYIHEVGHIYGEQTSFRNGGMLPPDQVRGAQVSLSREKLAVLQPLFVSSVRKLNHSQRCLLLDFGNEVMEVLTRGQFDPRGIFVQAGLTQRELLGVIQSRGDNFEAVGFSLDASSGQVQEDGSREARNMEMSSFAFELGGAMIIENAINRLGLRARVRIPVPNSVAHRRAHRIVGRAYRSEGWSLPSWKDLYAISD